MHRSETTVTMMLSVATLVWMLFLNVSTVDTFLWTYLLRGLFLWNIAGSTFAKKISFEYIWELLRWHMWIKTYLERIISICCNPQNLMIFNWFDINILVKTKKKKRIKNLQKCFSKKVKSCNSFNLLCMNLIILKYMIQGVIKGILS